MHTTDYLVTGMSCTHCEHAITEEVRQLPDVTGVEVHHETGLLTVTTGERAAADDAVLAAVEEAGYEARRA